MIRSKVILVNGKPQSGKTTFGNISVSLNNTTIYSSIDYVKEKALELGWDGKKDEAGRRYLSDLKEAMSRYNNIPRKKIIEQYDIFKKNLREDINNVLIVDVREPDELDALKNELNAITVFIDNPRVPDIVSNMADKNVANYNYDYTINNYGTMDDYISQIYVFFLGKLIWDE